MKGLEKKLIIGTMAAFSLAALGGCVKKPLQLTPEASQCVQEWEKDIREIEEESPNKTYKKGELLVHFDDGTTKEEASAYIRGKGLWMRKFRPFSETHIYAVAKVPRGYEIDWMCEMNSEEGSTIVEIAQLNSVIKIGLIRIEIEDIEEIRWLRQQIKGKE